MTIPASPRGRTGTSPAARQRIRRMAVAPPVRQPHLHAPYLARASRLRRGDRDSRVALPRTRYKSESRTPSRDVSPYGAPSVDRAGRQRRESQAGTRDARLARHQSERRVIAELTSSRSRLHHAAAWQRTQLDSDALAPRWEMAGRLLSRASSPCGGRQGTVRFGPVIARRGNRPQNPSAALAAVLASKAAVGRGIGCHTAGPRRSGVLTIRAAKRSAPQYFGFAGAGKHGSPITRPKP